MKGQYSLDFLIVFTGFMAFFLVMASLSVNIGSDFSHTLASKHSLVSTRIISDYSNTLCLMQPGSVQQLRLYFPEPIRLTGGHVIRAVLSNKTFSFDQRCLVHINSTLHGTYNISLTRLNNGVYIKYSRL